MALQKFILKTLPDTEWASETEADKQKNFKSPSVNGDLFQQLNYGELI